MLLIEPRQLQRSYGYVVPFGERGRRRFGWLPRAPLTAETLVRRGADYMAVGEGSASDERHTAGGLMTLLAR